MLILRVVICTDECAVCQATHSQDSAWVPRGQQTARLPRPLQNAGRISVLPAVSLDGLLAVIAQPGSILHVDFEYFLEFVLVRSNSFVFGFLMYCSAK